MSDLKIAVGGLDYLAEQTITQFVIPAGAGATFAVSNNVATITTNAAHGLTFSPSAGVPPNYFIQPATSTSGLTGTGILVGNNFRILTIPSTTTFTIYTTVTAATVTSTTFNPIFFPITLTALISSIALQPAGPFPYYGTIQLMNLTTGANLAAQYNPDNTNIPLDATTGNTLGTAPTMRTLVPASSQGQIRLGPQDFLIANGTTATSRYSILE
jgi:hypothetical protein